VSLCTSLPGPPGDPTRFRQTKVDGPGKLSKVVYGKAETPRNLPKTAWGNPDTYRVFGKQYSVMDSSRGFSETGVASWYGTKFHGRTTSSGEVYNMYNMTAAHKHLPLPTFVRVTNLDNGRELDVKVNDRGPFVDDRIIDLSYGAAAKLGVLDKGTARVRIVAISENVEPGTTVATASPERKKKAAPEQDTDAAYVEILASGNHLRKQAFAGLGASSGATSSAAAVRQPVPVRRRQTDAVRPAVQPAIAASGVVIQVGAFSSAANAESMRQRVNRAVNDDAAIIHTDPGGSLLRVQVGPLPQTLPADAVIQQLRQAGIDDIAVFNL